MAFNRNIILLCISLLVSSSLAFVPASRPTSLVTKNSAVANGTFLNARKNQEDLSYIESRDLTREEMLDINAQNEEIMNMELSLMTGFSLILSLPILYLCWVAFYSE